MPVLVAITVLTAIMGYMASREQTEALREAQAAQKAAAAEAAQIASMNAQRSEAEDAETARRIRGKSDNEEAMARAQAAASGFTYNEDDAGSIALSLYAQREENMLQREYETLASKSRADILRRGGTLASEQGRAQAAGTGAQATASQIGGFGQIAQGSRDIYNWWTSPGTTTTSPGFTAPSVIG